MSAAILTICVTLELQTSAISLKSNSSVQLFFLQIDNNGPYSSRNLSPELYLQVFKLKHLCSVCSTCQHAHFDARIIS